MSVENETALWRVILKSKGLWAFLLYALTSLIFTYPMIFRLNAFPYTGAEPLPPGSDIFIYLWDMWWVKQALMSFSNPFWTDYLFHPYGVSLLFSLANIVWAIISMPFQSFVSLIAIYNLCFIFSLILSGMGAFWLIRYLTKSTWGAFIGGVIFAFAPYHFVHIGHMTCFSVQWLPFFILFFLKMFDGKGWSNAILAALFWAFTCYSDLNYAVFITVFIILFFIFKCRYERKQIFSKSYLKRLILMGCVFTILVGPYAMAIFRFLFSGEADISHPLHSSVSQSADLFSFFVPSFMHPIFGQIVRPFYEHVTTYNGYKLGGYIEVTAFIGFSTIFLVIFALRSLGRRRLRFWIFTAIVFFVLTLGPVLKAGGLVKIPAGWMHLDKIARQIEPNLDPLALEIMKKSVGIPLPYLLWHFTPFLSGAESAGRLNIMFVLSWAVLCGFGAKCLFEKIKKRNKAGAQFICAGLTLFILFEYAPFPIKMVECPVSIFYKRLADDPDDYALIDLPILNSQLDANLGTASNKRLFGGFNNTSSKRSMYNQTVHHKRIVNGMTCRRYQNIRNFIDNTAIMRLLAYPQELSDEEAIPDLSPLKKHKIKYIVLHRSYLAKNEFTKLTLFLENKFKKVFNDQELTAYQTYY